MKGHIKAENIEDVIIDAGMVYLNYGEEEEKLLAPCKGDNTFSVDSEIREIEANGLRGKTKGLRRKIREDASITVNLMDISLDNLKTALAGSTLSLEVLSHGWDIAEADYLKNVTVLGETLDGEYKKFTIFNALSDEPIEVVLGEDNETAIAVKFSAHHNLPDDEKLWEIEDLTSLV